MSSESSRYQEFPPPPALQNLLRCGWTFRQKPIDPAPALVIPDGCADLMWDGERLVLAGPDRVATWANPKPGATLASIRLAPGVAAGFLGLPLTEVVDQRLPLQALWGKRAIAIECELEHASPAQAVELLQTWFGRTAEGGPDKAMAWVFEQLAKSTAPRPAVLALHLGISERSLRRRCQHAFGYGPKTLARILRLQRFVAVGGMQPSLSMAALEAGYGDQAHLAHEVKLLTGITPTALLAQRDG